MQVRTQLAVVAVVAAGWSAGNATRSSPVVHASTHALRDQLRDLEQCVERDPDNVRCARALAASYLEQDNEFLTLLIQKVGRMTTTVQNDGRVTLHVATAYERIGDVQAALARVNGALSRCEAVPVEVADSVGCDASTQATLAIEGESLRCMIHRNVTPSTDAYGARRCHDESVRITTLAPMRF
jgi:hypothetical protein